MNIIHKYDKRTHVCIYVVCCKYWKISIWKIVSEHENHHKESHNEMAWQMQIVFTHCDIKFHMIPVSLHLSPHLPLAPAQLGKMQMCTVQ